LSTTVKNDEFNHGGRGENLSPTADTAKNGKFSGSARLAFRRARRSFRAFFVASLPQEEGFSCGASRR
jgi:hypothetical protein